MPTVFQRFHLPGWFQNRLLRRVSAVWLLFALSALLILPNLGYPRAIIFDETYFIPTTQRYLNNVFFQESHPPLAKLLITLGQVLVHPESRPNDFSGVEKINRELPADQDMTGYRLMPALFGLLTPLLVFLILGAILHREVYAFVIALFVAFDNALIVQARAALIDSFLLVFCLAAILLFVRMVKRGGLGTAALWGVVIGCAASVKLTGLFVLVLFGAYLARLVFAHRFRQTILTALVFASAFAVTFLGVWQIHFSIASKLGANDYGISEEHRRILQGIDTPDPFTRFAVQFRDALEYQQRYEAGVPKLDLSKPDEIGSPWYLWLVGGRAIDYRWETPDGTFYRYIYLLGNPITWLVSLIGVIAGTALVLSDLLFRFLRAGNRLWLYVLVLLYWSYMIPMFIIPRVMYLYHYFPPMLIGVMLFGIVLWQAQTLTPNLKRDTMVVALILLVFMFWVYKPLTYYDPLTREQFQQRNIFPAWDLRCVGCK